MQRVLLRAPTTPFEVPSPAQVIEHNLIAGNAGNLVFLHAAYRILATPGVELSVDRLRVDPADAAHINEAYDCYVVPFANAFRLSYEPTLILWTELIRRLRIPVVVLGIGAQSTLDYELDRLRPIDGTVKDFVGAVLDHAPSIGVRGEFSAHYLRSLGFGDVAAIGCPSMFLDGPRLAVQKKVPTLAADSPIAINGSPYRPAMGRILAGHAERYRNLVYVAQDLDTLVWLVHGDATATEPPCEGFPDGPGHALFRAGRVREFTHPWPWIDFLRSVDFAFGSRIHGNLVALMAGTPAYVLAHDSRTLELARYFDIPHRRLPDVPPDVEAADLYAEADYSRLTGGHAARWATFEAFLDQHGLANVHAAGGADAFDARTASLSYPVLGDPGATPSTALTPIARLRLLGRHLAHRRWVMQLRVRLAQLRRVTARR